MVKKEIIIVSFPRDCGWYSFSVWQTAFTCNAWDRKQLSILFHIVFYEIQSKIFFSLNVKRLFCMRSLRVLISYIISDTPKEESGYQFIFTIVWRKTPIRILLYAIKIKFYNSLNTHLNESMHNQRLHKSAIKILGSFS